MLFGKEPLNTGWNVLTLRNGILNHLSFIPSAHLTDSVKSYFPNLFWNSFPPHFPSCQIKSISIKLWFFKPEISGYFAMFREKRGLSPEWKLVAHQIAFYLINFYGFVKISNLFKLCKPGCVSYFWKVI